MRIHNPATGEHIETHCDGVCYCHGMPITFGESNGCCNNCGCPKNVQGWKYWIENKGITMTTYPELINLIKNHALLVRGPDEPPFVLKSGETSHFYLDCRKLTLHDKGLHAIVDAMWEKICDLALPYDIDAIGGPCVGSDPIVGGLLYRSGFHNSHGDIRGFLVRKEEKGHGKPERVIGSMQPGDNCLFVEDVTTTGGTSLEAIDCVEAYGGKVKLVFAVIDRLAGAKEAFAARNIPFYPLLTIDDLGI